MEKWARKLQLIINRRDALLKQLNDITSSNYTYTNIRQLNINDFNEVDSKIVFSHLVNSMDDYNQALNERDQLMFGKFLDCIIHDKTPTKESQNWCAFQY